VTGSSSSTDQLAAGTSVVAATDGGGTELGAGAVVSVASSTSQLPALDSASGGRRTT
jgi:hypothetical protein